MTSKVIGGTIHDLQNIGVTGARIIINLNGDLNRVSDEASIARRIEKFSASDGTWSLAVECNDQLTPAGSSYQIHEIYPGGETKTYFVRVLSSLPGGTNQVLDLITNQIPELGDDMAVIQDGVSGAILATVKSLTNSKPLMVAIADANGDQIVSFGGGTQYTEDAASAADPIGSMEMFVRKDVPAALVTTDGDNVARRGNNFGAAYSSILTSAGAVVDTFGGGTQYTEDAVAAADPVGNGVILVRKDVPAATVSADLDNIAQRGSNFGAAYVTILDSAGAILSTFPVAGTVAEDAALSGNPQRIGVRASTAVPTAMSADNDIVTPWADRSGAQIVIPQPRSAKPSATPTIATSGYVAGDRVGTVMTFTAAALAAARITQLVQASITCRTAAAKNDLNLWLFETNPTIASADNAPLDITGANLEAGNPIGVIQFLATDYYDTANSCMCNASLNKGPVTLFGIPTAGADIFGVLEMGTTVAAQYAGTTDLIVKLWTNPC